MKAANKVVLNTGILYGRMLLTVGISLYTTRLVLNALGSTDFGIFQLVAGVIAMLSFLNNAMATSTQRFLSFYQGENDMIMQKKVFINSLQIHIIIGLILVIVLESLGFFLFDGFLNIPLDRMNAAKAIYHFMSATVFFTVLSVPFMGTLIAHENLLWVSIVGIVETLLKLGIALLLLTLLNDKLFIYGLLTECICLLSLILYAVFCFKKYKECTLEGLFTIDRVLMKQLSSFAGWNLFGALCGLGRTQGLAILLNLFCRTSSAEAIRIVRTNLEFMLNKVPDGLAKTVFVTSTFPTEGKTFISVNLAATFALSGRRVLLLGADIRNPKFGEYIDVPSLGLTNYLSSTDKNVNDYIIKLKGYENFFVFPSGVIPPNPAELLMSKKVDQLFAELKKEYDYIIVDTAPVSLVTDTLLIAKNADTFVYVMRANVLEKRMLAVANTFYKEKKLPNMCIVLNDTDSTKGYGYGYGYGVRVDKKPWYKKFFS